MAAYLPHNRCSQFYGTSSAQSPMALSIPIILSHMYTLGHITPRQRGLQFLFFSGTFEVLQASHKGCHILKKSPENVTMAVTCKGVADRLPAWSGDTSAMKPYVLGMNLSLPMLLYPRKAFVPWIFQQGSVRELAKPCPMKLLCWLQWVECMGRV